jgi:hypothetical protein
VGVASLISPSTCPGRNAYEFLHYSVSVLRVLPAAVRHKKDKLDLA